MIQIQTARDVVANPAPHHSPTLRTLAWCQLKSERGQTVNQSMLHQLRVARLRQAAQPRQVAQ